MWLILRSSSVHPLILSCSARNLLIPRTPWCPTTSGCLSALYLSSLECFYLPQYENGLFFFSTAKWVLQKPGSQTDSFDFTLNLTFDDDVLKFRLVWTASCWDRKKSFKDCLGAWRCDLASDQEGGKNDREEENNAGQRRLPQHWGAKLSAAVWEWCDQRLLEGRAWRVAEAPSVKGKTSSLQMEYKTWQAAYWSSFQTFFI